MEIMTLNPSLPFTLESGFGNSNLSFHVSELAFLSVEFFFSFTGSVFFYMFQT